MSTFKHNGYRLRKVEGYKELQKAFQALDYDATSDMFLGVNIGRTSPKSKMHWEMKEAGHWEEYTIVDRLGRTKGVMTTHESDGEITVLRAEGEISLRRDPKIEKNKQKIKELVEGWVVDQEAKGVNVDASLFDKQYTTPQYHPEYGLFAMGYDPEFNGEHLVYDDGESWPVVKALRPSRPRFPSEFMEAFERWPEVFWDSEPTPSPKHKNKKYFEKLKVPEPSSYGDTWFLVKEVVATSGLSADTESALGFHVRGGLTEQEINKNLAALVLSVHYSNLVHGLDEDVEAICSEGLGTLREYVQSDENKLTLTDTERQQLNTALDEIEERLKTICQEAEIPLEKLPTDENRSKDFKVNDYLDSISGLDCRPSKEAERDAIKRSLEEIEQFKAAQRQSREAIRAKFRREPSSEQPAPEAPSASSSEMEL